MKHSLLLICIYNFLGLFIKVISVFKVHSICYRTLSVKFTKTYILYETKIDFIAVVLEIIQQDWDLSIVKNGIKLNDRQLKTSPEILLKSIKMSVTQ